MASMIVPPGGFTGFSQMTAASRLALSPRGAARAPGRRRRRKAKASKSARRSAKGSKRSGGRKLKFGSPAWQKKYKVGKYRK